MKELHELKQKMMEELKEQAREVGKKNRMTAGDLDTINKLVKSIDRLCTIIESEESGEGYSGNGSWRAGGEYGYSARNRNSMGRYTRMNRDDPYSGVDGGSYSRNNGSMYSMDNGFVEELEEKMRMEKDPEVRDALKRCISAMRG